MNMSSDQGRPIANTIVTGDCLDVMDHISDKSIDMILCDPPYGSTNNKWDIVIPFNKLWTQYNRVIKDSGAIVLFGSGLFGAQLIMSNQKMYRYSFVWQKTTSTGFLNAKKQPLRSHEDIHVFYKKQPTYNPQLSTGHRPVNSYTKYTSDGTNYGSTKMGIKGGGSTLRYPTSVLKYPTDKQRSNLHPTQKPLELCQYLIRTYSNPGDTILDNCAGSGTTGLAAKLESRNFILIEKDEHYTSVANQRIA